MTTTAHAGEPTHQHRGGGFARRATHSNTGGSGWMDRAACRGIDPDLFFPERGESTAEPKAICADCPVRAECLEYALANREKHGIWGGASERERRRIRRRRAAARRDRETAA